VRVIVVDGGLPGIGGDNRLQLLWGHRRAAAFKRLKRETIPAQVYEEISDEQARLLLLIENGQQKPLNPIQEARGYAEMVRDFGLSQEEVATQVNKSRPVIANAVRLLDLPASVQDLIADRKLTTAHGVALLRFKEHAAACLRIAALVIEQGTPAGDLEKGVPFADELDSEGVVVRAGWNWEPTSAQRKDPEFIKDGYNWICLNPTKWKALQKEKAAKKREETKRIASKQKNQKKEYVGGRDGVAVEKKDKYLLALVPDSLQVIGKRHNWDDEKVTLVTDEALWKRIKVAAEKADKENTATVVGPVMEKAWEKVKTLKKLDGWAFAALLQNVNELTAADFRGRVVKDLGLKIGNQIKKVFPNGNTLNLHALAECDLLELAKLRLGGSLLWLESRFKNNWAGESEVADLVFLSGIPRTELGFLTEETMVALLRADASLKIPQAQPEVEAPAPAKAKKGGKK
jgi:ParB/RepB/Spo0J family partition protein